VLDGWDERGRIETAAAAAAGQLRGPK